MKDLKRYALGAMTGVFFFASVALAQAEQVKIGSMSVEAPANWYQTTVPSDERRTRAVLASNTSADKQALMMISVVPRNGRSLESMNAATRNYIATRMDGVLEFERSTNIDGAPAHTFVYEGRSEHSQLGRRKFMRTIISRGDSFYILHGVADHIPFSNYAGTMEKMINSAKWTN